MVKSVSFWGLFIVRRLWSLFRFSPVPNSLIGKCVTAIFLKEPLKIKENFTKPIGYFVLQKTEPTDRQIRFISV